MLTIRLQRTGRKGHASFRLVVQDSRQTPTSGNYVALIGSYDPHAKTATVVKDKAQYYLDHGAQPSGRVVRLLKEQGVKLPEWVEKEAKKTSVIRHPEKLRRNQPKVAAAPAAEAAAEEPSAEKPEEPAAAQETDAPAAVEVEAEKPAE